eukprot:5409285-Alexandrium_andersonii.AAC.1
MLAIVPLAAARASSSLLPPSFFAIWFRAYSAVEGAAPGGPAAAAPGGCVKAPARPPCRPWPSAWRAPCVGSLAVEGRPEL